MMPIYTHISDSYIHMRFADNPDAAHAHIWIDFRVPIEGLTLATASGEQALGDPEKRWLGTIRLAALRYARDVLSAETQDLSSRISQ
jgi:hypothetical protein